MSRLGPQFLYNYRCERIYKTPAGVGVGSYVLVVMVVWSGGRGLYNLVSHVGSESAADARASLRSSLHRNCRYWCGNSCSRTSASTNITATTTTRCLKTAIRLPGTVPTNLTFNPPPLLPILGLQCVHSMLIQRLLHIHFLYHRSLGQARILLVLHRHRNGGTRRQPLASLMRRYQETRQVWWNRVLTRTC